MTRFLEAGAWESLRRQGPVLAALLLTFLSFVFSPLYMIHLRHQLERGLPEEWAKVTNNGPFTYIGPLLVTTRNHEEGVYAMKLRQIALHGFPYDPHTGDRSLKSWFLDCMMFYILAPFLILARGDVQRAWVLAHAFLGTLWVFSFYKMFGRFSGDEGGALIAVAAAAFFFIDPLNGLFNAPYSYLARLLTLHFGLGWVPHWLFLLIAWACGPVQWMRLPSPGMTMLLNFWCLAGAYLLATAKSRKILWSAGLGLATGLLCLVHPYEWMLGVGGLCSFFAGAWLWGLPWPGRWNLGVACLGAVGISIAYYVFAHRLTQGVTEDIISRVGSPHQNSPNWASVYFLGWALLLLWKAFRAPEEARWRWVLWGTLFLTVVGICNIQVVLGYDMQFSYHMVRFGSFIGSLAVLNWLLESPRLRAWLKPRAAVLLAALFGWIFLREKGWADTHYRIFGTPRDVESAAQWINHNAPPDSTLVLISGALTEFLPLKIDVRYLVSNGSPSYGSPVPTERNLRGLATILKTVHADPELFLKKRWRHFVENDERKQQGAYLTRNLGWEQTQRGAWPYFLLNVQAFSEEPWSEKELLRYYREAAPLRPPFYFWLHKGEEIFLRSPPEKLGAALVYQNPSVRIYFFRGVGRNRA